MIDREKKHIEVCVLTYKREALLRQCLESLISLRTEGLFSYSILIVENSIEQESHKIYEDISRRNIDIKIRYILEPDKNIAKARNCAAENFQGDYLAFIDDDEYADRNWLLNLYKTASAYDSMLVNGRVVRLFDYTKYKFYDWAGFFKQHFNTTGTSDYIDKATNNCLFKSELFVEHNYRFDQDFGLTGGEDKELIDRLIAAGHKNVWCNEAVVYEYTGENRLNMNWVFKRYFRFGGTDYRIYKKHQGMYKAFWRIIKIKLNWLHKIPYAIFSFLFCRFNPRRLLYICISLVVDLGEVCAFWGFVYKEYKKVN